MNVQGEWGGRGAARTAFFLVFLQVVMAASFAEASEDTRKSAEGLFRAGRFAEAEAAYREMVRVNPGDAATSLALGRVLLFGNSLVESEAWLKRAIELDKNDKAPLGLLAENYSRRGEFRKAADLFEAIGAKPRAAKCRRLSMEPAYAVHGSASSTRIPFIQTDPLPLLAMRMGGVDGFFLVDTGAPEIDLNADFAERAKLESLGEQIATYAGGLKAKTTHAVADAVEIGDFTVRNVPVMISERRSLGLPGFARPIDGIIGTAFLSRFRFTLDYVGGALVLERPVDGKYPPQEAAEGLASAVRVPIWLCGDHYIMGWGAVNGVPAFLLVDTGMAGGGFSVSERMLKEAGIALPEESGTGTGGGGAVTVKRIRADLALGDAREAGVDGFWTGASPGIEGFLGFRQDGIISHGFFRQYRCVFDFISMTLTMIKDR